MESFVLVGKARTVFRLLELKVKYEDRQRRKNMKNSGSREPGKGTG